MKKEDRYYCEAVNKGNSVAHKLRNGGIVFGVGLILLLICAVVLHLQPSPEPASPPQSDDKVVEDNIEAVERDERDRKTEAIDASGRFYESVVGYGDEPIEFGSLDSYEMDLIDVMPLFSINDSPEDRHFNGSFEGWIKPNTPYKVYILVDNESLADAGNVQVQATICWLNRTRLRLIARIFYGTGSVVEYAEDFWVNDDSEVWQVEPVEVSVVSAADGMALDVPEGRYWVGGQPIPVSSDDSGLLLSGFENARIVEYTLNIIPNSIDNSQNWVY